METARGDCYRLGGAAAAFEQTLNAWAENEGTRRIWDRDATVWSGRDEADWLGWLDAVAGHRKSVPAIETLVDGIKADGMTDLLLLGMGGSSLCPEVVAETFGPQQGFLRLHVLDSTVPDQVRRFRDRLDLSKTIVSVASKSGSTVEPNVLLDYFTEQLRSAGVAPGPQTIAVTDPGSALEARAKEASFRSVMLGVPEIGGRFSALSNFGLLPAGCAGVDLGRYLDRAQETVDACRSDEENPGVLLGAALGAARSAGRDKITLIVSPPLWDIGAWIEQLVAESTGKVGVGLCPVDQEPVIKADGYSDDRIFVYVRLEGEADPAQDDLIESLTDAGHPTVTLKMRDVYDLGAEFYRWEFATAVVGALMEINPFDQPNVQESKDITSALLDAFEQDGALAEPEPVGAMGDLVVTSNVGGDNPGDAIDRLLAGIRPGDYFAISAYCDRTDDVQRVFQSIRKGVAERKRVATTLGYGPRFLHSTGQLHKGGPDTGVFLQITTSPDEDVAIPGKAATFGVLSRAQALGDYQALVEKGRRVVRLDLRGGLSGGIAQVEQALLDRIR